MIALNTGSSYSRPCDGRPSAEDIKLSSYPSLMTGLPMVVSGVGGLGSVCSVPSSRVASLV